MKKRVELWRQARSISHPQQYHQVKRPEEGVGTAIVYNIDDEAWVWVSKWSYLSFQSYIL